MSDSVIKLEGPADHMWIICSAADIQTYSIGAETRSFTYKPQEDITAYELALLMPMIVSLVAPYGGQYAQEYDLLPPEAKRHWVVKNAG
jgi:hypothetical protein